MQCRAGPARNWSAGRPGVGRTKSARPAGQTRDADSCRGAAQDRCTTRPDHRFGLRGARSGRCHLRACTVRAPIRQHEPAMTQTYRDLVIGGVLVAPIISYAAMALLLFLLLRPLLHLVGFSRYFSNAP